LEGAGQLSTFEFPKVSGSDFAAQTVSSTAQTSIRDRLFSRKVSDGRYLPQITSLVLPALHVTQFEPGTKHVSRLSLSPLSLRFTPPGIVPQLPPEFPKTEDRLISLFPVLLAGLLLVFFARNIRRVRKQQALALSSLFSRKNLKLPISRAGAYPLPADRTTRC
jgi:hypothetical protein